MKTIQENIVEVQKEVRSLLKYSEMDYAEKVYETGNEYIRLYLQEDMFADVILKSKIYWNWWKLQWHIRDLAYLKLTQHQDVCWRTLREIYNRMHNAKDLAEEIKPQAIVLKESYAEMITKLMEAP